MSHRPPKLYAITDARLCGLSHAEQVEAFCKGGASLIQLRDKQLSSALLYEQGKEALKIARRFQATLLINDRADIAAAVGADGVHVGQNDLPPEAVRKVLGKKAIVGLSTHNLEQARQALLSNVDYIAVGPIFPTSTKADHEPVVGLDQLREISRICRGMPLVAIGAVTSQNCRAVLDAGADAVAMISWLTQDPGLIINRTRETIEILSNSAPVH